MSEVNGDDGNEKKNSFVTTAKNNLNRYKKNSKNRNKQSSENLSSFEPATTGEEDSPSSPYYLNRSLPDYLLSNDNEFSDGKLLQK